MTDLKPAHFEIVKNILRKHLAGIEVRAFGSRVRGTAKEWSDLDLAVVSEKKLKSEIVGKLKMDFAESDLPFRVDVLEWRDISPEFRALIEEKYEILQSAGDGL
jgi:type I restriction enzyme S subunit